MKDSKTTLYLILPKLIWANPHFPEEVRPNPGPIQQRQLELSSALRFLATRFAFLTVSVWKGYFPSWMREAGVPPPQRRLEKHCGDSLIVTQCPEPEQRTWKESKVIHCPGKGLKIRSFASQSLSWRWSQLQCSQFIRFISCNNCILLLHFRKAKCLLISEKRKKCAVSMGG